MKHFFVIGGLLIAAGILALCIYRYAPEDLATSPTSAAPSVATSAEPAPAVTTTGVAFSSLTVGTHSGSITTRKNYAVYDQKGLLKLWTMAFGESATTTPAIDFTKRDVIGVFAGEKPTGGYAIEITKVVDSATVRTLSVTTIVPGPGCAVTESLTSPYEIVSLPASILPLAHQDATTTKSCN